MLIDMEELAFIISLELQQNVADNAGNIDYDRFEKVVASILKKHINSSGIKCSCPREDTTGETKVWCCNLCGKPTEEWWSK